VPCLHLAEMMHPGLSSAERMPRGLMFADGKDSATRQGWSSTCNVRKCFASVIVIGLACVMTMALMVFVEESKARKLPAVVEDNIGQLQEELELGAQGGARVPGSFPDKDIMAGARTLYATRQLQSMDPAEKAERPVTSATDRSAAASQVHPSTASYSAADAGAQSGNTTAAQASTSRPNDALDLSVLSERIPDCAANKPKAKTFLMVMSSHTGSTAIMSHLVQRPDMYWPGEHRIRTMEPLRDPQMLTNVTRAVEFTRTLFQEGIAAGKLVGFKMNSVLIRRNPELWKELVAEFDTRIIWNYRKNMFKRSIGRYPVYYLGDDTSVAGLEKNTQTEAGCKKGGKCTFSVNPRNLHCIMLRSKYVTHAMMDAVGVLTRGSNCALHVPYEDYLYHPRETVRQLETYLGLSPVETTASRVKATRDRMCSVVENYAEICAHFRACPQWGWMLDDSMNNCSCADYEYFSRGGEESNPICSYVRLEEHDGWCVGKGGRNPAYLSV